MSKLCHSKHTLGDVTIHEVSLGPRFLGGINVHSSTSSKIPILVFTFNTQTTWAGVRCYYGNTSFSRCLEGNSALCNKVLIGAGKTRKVPEQLQKDETWGFPSYRDRLTIWWCEQAKNHFAVQHLTVMLKSLQLTTEYEILTKFLHLTYGMHEKDSDSPPIVVCSP